MSDLRFANFPTTYSSVTSVMAASESKKQCMMPPDENFILKTGMEIMNWDCNGSTIMVDRQFREIFGCSIVVAIMLWQKIVPHSMINRDAHVSHMVWGLHMPRKPCSVEWLEVLMRRHSENGFGCLSAQLLLSSQMW